MTRLGVAKRCAFCANQRFNSSARRLAQRGCVLHHELHLLRQATLDDGVVLVEAERHRLAGENLLADLAVEETLHLLRRGRTMPLRHPGDPDLGKVVRRDHDAVLVLEFARGGMERL